MSLPLASLLFALALSTFFADAALAAETNPPASTVNSKLTSSTQLPPAVAEIPIGWCILAKPEAFAQAKSASFEYIELALQGVLPLGEDDFQKMTSQLRSLGLSVRCGYNAIPKEIRLVGPDIDAAKQDAHLAFLLKRAAVLKLRYIIFNAGASWRVPDGFSRDIARQQLAEFSRRFASAAAQQNTTVLLEPQRDRDSNLLTTIDEAVTLVKAVDHPNFQLMVDYSFLRIQKDDVRALLKGGGYLRHVHISNPEKNRTYPMSDADSDYASFFNVLKQIGYRGGLSVHASTSDFDADAPQAIAFLRTKARDLVDGATQAATP
jgi:sugar phosphate isomerase/epimerase